MRPGQVKPGRFYFVQSIVYNEQTFVGRDGTTWKIYKENFGVSSEDP
jgi:hypothetical protein